MIRLDLFETRSNHVRAEHSGVLDYAFVFENLHACDGRRARQRVAGICEATGEGFLLETRRHFVANNDAADRYITRVDSLCKADHVWRHAPVIDCEPLATASETSHDFIANHHDAKFVAERSDAGQVSRWRNENAVGSDDRLKHDRRNRRSALDPEDVAQMRERTLRLFNLTR